jgi:hypothetical protein
VYYGKPKLRSFAWLLFGEIHHLQFSESYFRFKELFVCLFPRSEDLYAYKILITYNSIAIIVLKL